MKAPSRKNLLGTNQDDPSGSKHNLLVSESKKSMDQRMQKFQQNFTATGHCKQHG